jgi:predicted nucleic acid-binding protein
VPDYWDASAILKLYASEDDSEYFLNLTSALDKPIFSSAIAATEILCALFRKETEGVFKAGLAKVTYQRFRSDCETGRILLVPYGGDVLEEVERIIRIASTPRRPLMIRSLDLIHLATALVIKSTVLVATDQRLRTMGSRLKLKLLPH